MSDALPERPSLDPASLAGASLARSRKGFEPTEVRSLLGRAADALRVWAARDRSLTHEVEDLVRRLEDAERLDEAKLTEMLGAETTRIVAAARGAAAEMRSQAQREASELVESSRTEAERAASELVDAAAADRQRAVAELAEAQGAAEQLRTDAAAAAEATTTSAADHAEELVSAARSEADRLVGEAQARHDELIAGASTVFDERTAEAEAEAARIRSESRAEADRAAAEADDLLSEARADAEQLRAEAVAAASRGLDEARAEGREMVAEAKAVRQRMLRDLAERSHAARRKLEAARAARDQVVEVVRTASGRLEDTIGELAASEQDVRQAADRAFAAVPDDVETVVRELEAELVGAGGPLPDAGDDAPAGAVVGDVGTADVDLVVAGSGGASSTAHDAGDDDTRADPAATPVDEKAAHQGTTNGDEGDLGPNDAEGRDGDVDEDDGIDPPAGGAEEPGGGMASVHDLFERLRAAEPADAPPDESTPEAGAPRADAAAAERSDADVDLTGSATAPGSAATAAVSPTSATAVAVAEEEALPAPPEPVEEVTGAQPVLAEQGEAALLDRRDELLAPAERLLARNLKRLVSDEQNEVLDRARRQKRGRVELDDLLPSDGQAEHFAEALADPWVLAATAGSQMWAELTESPPGGISADVVADPLATRVTELLELRRLHVRSALEQFDRSGDDGSELVDHLRAAYRELRATSVPELASDLAAAGFNTGTAVAAGDEATWRWVPDNGGLPCADAEDNALAGPTPCGAAFPTGDAAPPAHPGCRCILVPADAP